MKSFLLIFKDEMKCNCVDYKFVSGSCPICETGLTIGMKGNIRSIRIAMYRSNNSDENVTIIFPSKQPSFTTLVQRRGTDLEVEPSDVLHFVKRFRY